MGGGSLVDPRLMVARNGEPFAASPLEPIAGGGFLATLAASDCGDSVRYYVTAGLSNGGTYRDPPTAPTASFSLAIATGVTTVFTDEFEVESGWTVNNLGPVSLGTWERGNPNGVTSGGVPVVPEDDFTPAPGVNCFVTYNAPPGTAASAGDLDGGPTVLTSPAIDLAGLEAEVSFAAFFYCNDVNLPAEADFLLVQVSANGTSWVTADTIATTNSQWEVRSFRLNDFIQPSATTRIRFLTNDTPNNSITEAAVDSVRIVATVCEQAPACPADLNGDRAVNAADLAVILGGWGQPGPSDIDGDGTTNAADLAAALGAWGACP